MPTNEDHIHCKRYASQTCLMKCNVNQLVFGYDFAVKRWAGKKAQGRAQDG